LIGVTTVVVNQAVQSSSLGDKASRLGLEAMQSIDLASSKSAGLSAFLANEPQSGSPKGFESSSKTELPGMSDCFRPSAAGGQEGPRPIISAELLLHLSSATSLDQTANTVTAVSQESQDCCHYSLPSDPQVPSPIPRAGAGQSGEGVLPSKSSVPPAPIGGWLPGTLESQIALSATFAEIDKRRLPMALVSKTNSFSTNNASQSLPHWLREFFKPEQTPLPKPATLSPTITVTAEATAFLYKDCETSLPPFVHPGTLPTSPKNFSKRNKRQERNSEGSRVAGELDSVGGSEPVSQTLPNPGLDQSKMQTQFPAALPASLQQFVAGLKSNLTGGGVQPASVPPLSPSFSKRLFDFSTPPPIEPSPQSSPFSKRPSVLAELMALKNLASVSLPLTPPLNRFPLQSVLDINPIPQLGFSTSDPNLPLENCVQQGERWVHSQDSPYFAVTKHPHHSVIANRELPAMHHHRSSGSDVLASKHGGKAPLVHVHQPRIMKIH
jgi:hypothetical protein